MNLTVKLLEGVRFEVQSGTHAITTDQPLEDGGTDAGMSPIELFVGSLASCVAYFVGRFCDRHQIASEGLTIDVEWSTAEQPHRVGSITLRISLPTELTPEQQSRLLKVAHGCTVHQSLVVPPAVEITVQKRSGQPALQG